MKLWELENQQILGQKLRSESETRKQIWQFPSYNLRLEEKIP